MSNHNDDINSIQKFPPSTSTNTPTIPIIPPNNPNYHFDTFGFPNSQVQNYNYNFGISPHLNNEEFVAFTYGAPSVGERNEDTQPPDEPIEDVQRLSQRSRTHRRRPSVEGSNSNSPREPSVHAPSPAQVPFQTSPPEVRSRVRKNDAQCWKHFEKVFDDQGMNNIF